VCCACTPAGTEQLTWWLYGRWALTFLIQVPLIVQVLGQLHPATARIEPDEDGLLPEWIIYHELVATARTFLRYVGLHCLHCSQHLQLPADVSPPSAVVSASCTTRWPQDYNAVMLLLMGAMGKRP
jgi:hypothetical protein